jgi:transglutaminase-like putative cysteine protease
MTELAIAGLPGIGLPAAYISGYIHTIPPTGKEPLEGAHAMLAWHGARRARPDRTRSDQCDDDLQHHIVLAKGRDYADISPIAGLILSSREQGVDAKVDVVPRAQFKESATFSGRAFKYYI